MSTPHSDDNELEYYTAKQAAGQLSSLSTEETKKTSTKPVKSSTHQDDSKSKGDGYVPLKKTDDRDRDFERYQEITFAQKASDKAKQNPMIPFVAL